MFFKIGKRLSLWSARTPQSNKKMAIIGIYWFKRNRSDDFCTYTRRSSFISFFKIKSTIWNNCLHYGWYQQRSCNIILGICNEGLWKCDISDDWKLSQNPQDLWATMQKDNGWYKCDNNGVQTVRKNSWITTKYAFYGCDARVFSMPRRLDRLIL